jgi:hypothetical protein
VTPAAQPGDRDPYSDGVVLLDVIYVIAAIGLFALVALVAWGVEKL